MMNIANLRNPPLADHGALGWWPAKPMAGPFLWWLRDAWAVLTDKAVAVDFSPPQPRPAGPRGEE